MPEGVKPYEATPSQGHESRRYRRSGFPWEPSMRVSFA